MNKSVMTVCIVSIICFSAFSQSCHGGGDIRSQAPSTENSTQNKSTLSVQTICPVMGGVVDRKVYADWKGDEKNTPKRIYLCCPGCIESFNKNQKKYVYKLIKMKQPVENLFEKTKQ